MLSFGQFFGLLVAILLFLRGGWLFCSAHYRKQVERDRKARDAFCILVSCLKQGDACAVVPKPITAYINTVAILYGIDFNVQRTHEHESLRNTAALLLNQYETVLNKMPFNERAEFVKSNFQNVIKWRKILDDQSFD